MKCWRARGCSSVKITALKSCEIWFYLQQTKRNRRHLLLRIGKKKKEREKLWSFCVAKDAGSHDPEVSRCGVN